MPIVKKDPWKRLRQKNKIKSLVRKGISGAGKKIQAWFIPALWLSSCIQDRKLENLSN